MIPGIALILWCWVALAALGCVHAPAKVCGVFLAEADAPCPESGYASVVRVESGKEAEGVYRFHSAGSGVLIDRSGVLLTAFHVVNNKKTLAVFLDNEDTVYAAEPVPDHTFEDLDLAFLQIVGEGRKVGRGCILSRGLAQREFPEVRLASRDGPRPPAGSEVRVVGYPNEEPRVLPGRLVDPRHRLEQYVEENGLAPYASPEWTSFRPAVVAPDAPEGLALLLDGLSTLTMRVGQEFLFVELESSGRQPGISGGPVLFGDEVIGVSIESWNSFAKTILIAVPVWKIPYQRSLQASELLRAP